MAKQSTPQRKTVGRVMHEWKHGELESSRGEKDRTGARLLRSRSANPVHPIGRRGQKPAPVCADEVQGKSWPDCAAGKRGPRGDEARRDRARRPMRSDGATR